MSRSYRKNKILKDKNRWNKKYANRIVRRKMKKNLGLPHKDSDYKKYYESWNISDYAFMYHSYQDWYKNNREFFDSDEECYSWWRSRWVSK